MKRVVAIGECMIELAPAGGGYLRLGYAGDTFNTAIYMARLGLATSYASALGNGDPYSDAAIQLMLREGLDISLVERVPGRLPGLYSIQVDDNGERRFFYWRDHAPIRDLFATQPPPWRLALQRYDCIYLSGITLAVVGQSGRECLFEWLREARTLGVAIAFDANLRVRLWHSPAEARAALELFLPLCTYLSLSSEDIRDLWGEHTGFAETWSARGVEVIQRMPNLEAVIWSRSQRQAIAAPLREKAIDSTGAGDSFNAAYLAARLNGAGEAVAAKEAHGLAAQVVSWPGAILPLELMHRGTGVMWGTHVER
jgi:2-dehydro-3-deoxygluconokinase